MRTRLSVIRTLPVLFRLRVRPHYAAVCQLARPDGTAKTGVDVPIGLTAAAATSRFSSVYILLLNAISYVDAVNFQ
jgi:hypothetical protein